MLTCGCSKYYTSTKSALLQSVQTPPSSGGSKVTVVGVGQVGMACTFSILSQVSSLRISSEVCLVDCMEDKLMGEMMDLQHGSMFLQNVKITASADYEITSGSKLCIVCAGVRQKEGETRLDLVQRNTDVMKNIIPQLVKYSPDTILLVVSNPVDILTYITWKLSGLPTERVIGSGTNLDSSRFRFLLSQKLGVAATSCNGWIIGEHGDSSVPVWSGVNVAGVRLQDLNQNIGSENDKERWTDIHKEVVESAYQVIKLKGYTSWAIGMSVAAITQSILSNIGNVNAVSVLVKGFHGIKDEVYLSLPAILGSNGVTDIVKQPLTENERTALHQSARVMAEVQAGIKF